ncbi:precorrin-2 dehydrogenase/sirohydrochlorin ferrochelatase family protein [Bacillus solitudinis]|uniref:precorrin-2 dehydrogenase/sirohydrochlorin ferrochelatase family protein n=1 Tax=Bacillus solitudinis TaxID=2014074 RepID=UPI0012FE0222|nr:NAD(P)-dependent oxidoreductase [Bacillus solitudinis]
MLKFEGRHIVVIGAGEVAARRIPRLLEAGAKITVISPTLHSSLHFLNEMDEIEWKQVEAKEDETFTADLLMIATNNPKLNDSLYNNRFPHQWVYVASDPQKSDIHFPTVIEKERLTLALTTSGASPTYARRLRDKLAEFVSDEVEEELQFLEQARKQVLTAGLSLVARKRLLQRISTDSFLKDKNRNRKFQEALQIEKDSKM